MLRDVPRWVLVVLVLACVVGLIVWARGTEHYRGVFEGALDAQHSSSLGPEA
jgi:hypothetical protein